MTSIGVTRRVLVRLGVGFEISAKPYTWKLEQFCDSQ